MVFCLNPATISLGGFELGSTPVNTPPLADLQASPGSGPSPLSTTLDASLSFDNEGPIASYRFDPLGSGDWQDNGAQPAMDFVYNDPGVYEPQVEVTDGDGSTDIASTTVVVLPAGGYDEVEDNDDQAQANGFPGIPFSNFTGNCGPDGPEDGDTADYFTFNASPGDKVSFTCAYSPSGGTVFDVILFDSFGSWLGELYDDPNGILNYEFQGWEAAPFYLVVNAVQGTSDYFISCGDDFTLYHEFEDNDEPFMADYIYDLTFDKEVIGWTGSLGSGPGYPGYDGDGEDWAAFWQAPPGAEINLTLSYDPGQGSFGFALYDSDLDVPLASSADGDGSENIYYVVQSGDIEDFYIQITAASGFGDYTLDGTITINNPGYDEEEDNDNESEANSLPAIPFTGFTGNVGSGGVYDGDYDDYFSFGGSTGEMIRFTVTAADNSAELQGYLFDSNSRTIGGANWDPGTGVLTATVIVRSNDMAPFYLDIYASSGNTDYTIDAEVITDFSETEDNDDTAQANGVPNDFDFFSGSLGAGGYDGDSADYFTFSAPVDSHPIHDVYYDEALGTLSGTIYDSDGDIVGTSSDQGGGLMYCDFENPVTPDDTAPFFIYFTVSGATPYWFDNLNSYQ